MNRPAIWSDKRLKLLEELYPNTSIPLVDVARRLGSTVRAVQMMASRCSIRRANLHTNSKYTPPHTFMGPWNRRCPCGELFTTNDIMETFCPSCQ